MFDKQAARAWLDGLVGEWTFEFATADTSEHPGFRATGTETVRRIGPGILLEATAVGSENSQSHSATLICADAEKGRITGAVMSTAVEMLFNSVGELSDDGRSLTLETEGPAMTEGRETDRYRDIFHIIDSDKRFTAAEVFQDGEWKEFMRTQLVRVR